MQQSASSHSSEVSRSLDDVSWHKFVTQLLGSPQKVDFEKEAAKRAQRKGFVSKLVPNDDQCRYMWRFGDTKEEQQVAKMNNKSVVSDSMGDSTEKLRNIGYSSVSVTVETCSEPVGTVNTSAKLASESHLSFVTQMSAQSSRSSYPSDIVLIQSNNGGNDARELSRKRARITSSSDAGGWISRSKFYTDNRSGRNRKASSRNGKECFDKDTRTTASTRDSSGVNQRQLSPHRSKKNAPVDMVGLKSRELPSDAAAKQPGSPADDSPIEFGSPKEEISSKRRNTRLFKPTARRADQRLKQRTLKDTFFGGR